MSIVASEIEKLKFTFTHEIVVKSSLEATFAAILEQMGPGNETPDGRALQLVLEPWPGGRWFRDLGEGNGHYWGTVQAIKRPTLLEICGPLMISAPSVSNVQYRLEAVEGGTRVAFHHTALGLVPDGGMQGFSQGWTHILQSIARRAERT